MHMQTTTMNTMMIKVTENDKGKKLLVFELHLCRFESPNQLGSFSEERDSIEGPLRVYLIKSFYVNNTTTSYVLYSTS